MTTRRSPATSARSTSTWPDTSVCSSRATCCSPTANQTLGVSLPWAMAASLVRPGTQIVSVSGDGGFLFSAQELETATRLGLTFTHVIMRDNTYDMVGFQEVLKYGRKSGVQLGDYDIPHYAAAFGAKGYRVKTLDEFTTTLKHALSEDGPSLIDVPVDYSHNTDLAVHLH